ncbi:MAG: transposase [Nitrososphaerota archaeon]|nr:transposase [Nitrososphaerota archaeon]
MSFKGSLNVGCLVVCEVLSCTSYEEWDILILGNFLVHKVKGVLDSLVLLSVRIAFLPVYLPDFNSVEFVWSKVEAYLRKVKARTVGWCHEVF